MSRALLVLLVFLIGILGVIVYTGLSRDREVQRLIAEGDSAVLERQMLLAVEAYSGAIALDMNSMVAFLKRGEIYQRHGDLTAAMRDLLIATDLDPGATRPHERLGDVAYELRRYEESVTHYSHYLELDDRNPRVLYKLALVSERAGRVAHSIPFLRQAIALDSGFEEAHYLLGLCLMEQERIEEARDALSIAVELSPGFLEAREALVRVNSSLADSRNEN